MSRPILLQGETSERLVTLKEACEMEGSRLVSLRADELLGLVTEITSSPEGLAVVSIDGVEVSSSSDEEIAELKRLLAEAENLVIVIRGDRDADKSKFESMLSAAAEEKHDLLEANTLLTLELEKAKKEHLDLLGQFGDEQKKRFELASELDALKASKVDLEAMLRAEQNSVVDFANERDKLKAKVAELTAQLAPFQAALAAAAPKPASPTPADPPAEAKAAP